MSLRHPRPRPLAPLALLWLCALPLPSAAQSSVVEVTRHAGRSMATVAVLFEKRETSRRPDVLDDAFVRVQRPGSGVVVSSTGLLLTNDHLIAETVAEDGGKSDEFFLVVILSGFRQYEAEVVARDQRLDLALLQLELGDGESLDALPLAPLEGRVPGERVVAMSRPDPTARYAFAGTLGLPGGPVRLREAELAREEVLLSDTRYHDHLDGGPLLDDRARILGVHNSSHIEQRPDNFEEEEEDAEKKPNEDYAVIVNADAIRAAFGEWLTEDPAPLEPQVGRSAEVAPAAIEAVAPSVVGVWTGTEEELAADRDPEDPQAQRIPEHVGSGVVVDAAGLVLTSATLFGKDVESARVRLASGEEYPATLLKRDAVEEVALIRLELPEGVELPPAVLADSDRAAPGELIAVVGRPFGGPVTSSVGVLSASERELVNPWAEVLKEMGVEGEPVEPGHFIQVASWIHAGHWGGAVVDRFGRLLGIAVRQPEVTKGPFGESYLGFAAGITRARDLFGEVWKESVAPAAQPELVAGSDEELAERTTGVVEVVRATTGSLINIHVKKAEEKGPVGFDPFGGGTKELKLQGMGSGVVIDESGLALSNWHVVDAAMIRGGGQNPDYQIEVTLPNGKSYVADVLSTSRDDDLSLLSLRTEPGERLVPVPMGNSRTLRVGQPVVAIGNPHGLADSVSAGVISSLNCNVQIRGRLRGYAGMIMTDAAINPGNSGGALLDLQGNLIGINSAGSTGAGMAIPVNKAREVFSDKLLSAEKLRSVYLGLKVEEKQGGIVVTDVAPSSPAEDAMLEEGDRILSIGEQEMTTGVAFAQVRMQIPSGAAIPIVIERDDEELTLEITPLSYEAWRVSVMCGIEVTALDYAAENALVRDASVALHQSYTGNPDAIPSRMMSGALRVVRAYPLDDDHPLPVLPGDLLLGMSVVTRTANLDLHELVRFENVSDLYEAITPRATKEGEVCECWLLREGAIVTAEVFAKRPPRR